MTNRYAWSTIFRAGRYAAIGGAVMAGLEFTRTRASVGGSTIDALLWLGMLTVHWIIGVVPLAFGLAWIESHARAGSWSGLAYFGAWSVGVPAGVLLLTLHQILFEMNISLRAVGFELSWQQMALYVTWPLAFWGGLGYVVHAWMERREDSARRLHHAQIERVATEKRLADLELGSIRAQFEPHFMLSALSALESLYTRDRAVAERALDALIDFVRTSLLRLRRPVGTVADECALAWRYATGLLGSFEGATAVTLSVENDVSDMLVPPGMLLAFVHPILAGADAQTALVITAAREIRGVRLKLQADGFCEKSHDWAVSLQGLERRLVAIWGAAVHVDASVHGTTRLIGVLLPDARIAAPSSPEPAAGFANHQGLRHGGDDDACSQ